MAAGTKLRTAKNAQCVLKCLKDNVDPDGLDGNGDAAIHCFVRRQRGEKQMFSCLMAMLIHSRCDVDLPNANGDSALHLAADMNVLLMAKALLSFRADVNSLNRSEETPLDIAHRKHFDSELVLVLSGVGGQFRDAVVRDLYTLPALVLCGDRTDGLNGADGAPGHPHTLTLDDQSGGPEGAAGGGARGGAGGQRHVTFMTPDASVEQGLTLREVSSVKCRGAYVETPENSLTSDWVQVELSSPPLSPVSGDPGPAPGPIDLSDDSVHMKPTEASPPVSGGARGRGRGGDGVDGGSSLFRRLEQHTRCALREGLEASTDEGYAAWLQYRELKRSRKQAGLSMSSVCVRRPPSVRCSTSGEPLIFRAKGGQRVLCLDGGGVKGLIQIEILSEIEAASGRRIVELFDWIVGTSTGGILALALVYANMSLDELRRLYFELKTDVFHSPKMGLGCDTPALETLLKRTFGEATMLHCMDPKVLITAVDKSTTDLNLRLFNNCFNDEYSNALVWKVARYTSAAPIYFTECDNFVDGGVLANNPTDYALTEIQDFLDTQGGDGKIACVVSVGCGIFSPRKIGSTDLPYIAVGRKTKLTDVPKRLRHMITLLTTALTKSEDVARNCKSRCEKQGIPFFRFSPYLDEEVTAIESDDEKLCDIIVKAQMLLQAVDVQIDELIQHFYYTSAFGGNV